MLRKLATIVSVGAILAALTAEASAARWGARGGWGRAHFAYGGWHRGWGRGGWGRGWGWGGLGYYGYGGGYPYGDYGYDYPYDYYGSAYGYPTYYGSAYSYPAYTTVYRSGCGC